MSIVVRRFEEGDVEAVERLNERLARAHIPHRVYLEDLTVDRDDDPGNRAVHDALFVAADGDEVRGGAWLREQDFWIAGSPHRIGWMKYPVSESLADPKFAGVPASMILQLLRRQPRLMAAGMGGHDAPIARLLAGIRWSSATVPFLFRIIRPFQVLRGLNYARRRPLFRLGMDVAAWSGVGWLAHHALRLTLRATSTLGAGFSATVEPSFAGWADSVWEGSRTEYHALAVRDARALDQTYPPSLRNFERLRVCRRGSDVGWACAQILPPTPETKKYFGDLKVGMITDVLARPTNAADVLSAALGHFQTEKTDLVVTYLSHSSWKDAAGRLGFLHGPSTFALYRSPLADKLLGPGGANAEACHITRTDGHGHAA